MIKDENIIKVVYFDEGSATDLIYILAGGKSTNKKEHIDSKTADIAANAEIEANKIMRLPSILSAQLGAAANINFGGEGSTIVTRAIENTILTDYLDCVKGEGKSYIKIFPDCKPYPYPDSFAYFKMLTPYLKMTKGKIDVSNEVKIDLGLIDDALTSGRGYYELMVDCDNGERVVLRFNIKAFRNNYYISDLVKMNLDYHAVEVGTVSISNLTMQSEFGNKEKKEINGFRIGEGVVNLKPDEVKVYDVILAGVRK